MSTVLDFGKHDGKTLIETVFSDPAWFHWAVREGVFDDRGGPSLQAEAASIWLKARNISIPKAYPAASKVVYYYQGWNHKFMDARVLTDWRFEEHADVRSLLDLGYVSDNGHRDRLGNDLLTKAIKRIVFSGKARVTRDMLEEFFASTGNFDLPVQQASE
jgi:hypothetical protein